MKKETAFAILEEFYGRYDDLSGRDKFIQDAKKKLVELCGGEKTDFYYEVANTLQDLMCSCGTVGYFLGVGDGAKLIDSLTSGDFAERFLSLMGDLS